MPSRRATEHALLRRLARWAPPAVALTLAGAAFLVLSAELRQVRAGDVLNVAWHVEPWRLGAALALTILAYGALAGYDALALAYVQHPLGARRVVLGSAITYGVSQTLGFPLITGGAIRFRLWSAWGLTPLEIVRAAGFVGLTFAIGLAGVAGVALLLGPSATLALLHLPPVVARVAGAALVAAVATYLAVSVGRRGGAVRVRGWTIAIPPPALALAQVALTAVDWTLAAAVLYVLVPDRGALPFLPFVGAFVLAQGVGFLSHIPGGVGVFDSIMLLLLRPVAPSAQVLGVLLTYRTVYYLLPFVGASGALGAYEVHLRGARVAAVARGVAAFARRWTPALLPSALSAATFVAGAVLLFSGATPTLPDRVAALDGVLPLVELSHLAGSVAGAGLLVLAWALRRRLDAAWALTVALLGIGIVASLLKGLDWEEALALGAVLAVVLPARHAFYRQAALTAEPLTPGWIIAVLGVVGASVWVGLMSYRDVPYSGDLWWHFATHADAPRFLRASAGAVAVLLVVAMLRLLRHAEVSPHLPDGAALEQADAVAARSHDTRGLLALLGDKALLFADSGDAFIQYGVEGRSWVALGDPIGPSAARADLAWRFHEVADRHGGWTVFYQVGAENLPLYIDLGLTLLKLGEEAHVPLEEFSLQGGRRKGLRRVVRDVEGAGVTFEIVAPEQVPALLPALRRVSDAWLADRATREKGFSLGRFEARYLSRFPVALARDASGEIVAFANIWATHTRDELSVDLMRYTANAPSGVMEYLLVQIMCWGRANRFATFNLGMAPLAGLGERPIAPRWSRLGAMVYRHGEHFYHFRGLRQYKEKFAPVWMPRYLASPGGLALPRVIANITTLIAGGAAGVIGR